MRLALVLVLALALPGCSFFLRGGPPPRCQREVAAPIIDTIIASAFIAGAIWAQVKYGCPSSRLDGCHNYNPAPLFIVPALPFTVSAVYGYTKTAQCRRQSSSDQTGAPPAGSSGVR